jgi:superfamily I DNA/RNA helicase
LIKGSAALGIAFSPAFAQTLDRGAEIFSTDLGAEMDDIAYTEVQRLRAMMLTWRDTRFVGPMADRVRFMWEIHEDAFKKGFWDFTWLLEEGIRKDVTWSADYCAVDEINDLNALQATLAARITGGLVEYVGDLDQAIYGFAGVDPQKILQILPYDTMETMELSRRLTPPIAEAAERCLSQAHWRSGGRIKTERAGGRYHTRQIIENVLLTMRKDPMPWGNIYVIGRTNWIVDKVRQMAMGYGMNVANTGEEDLLRDFCKLIADPQPNMRHSMIPALTASFLPSNEYYRKGAKAALHRLQDAEPDGWMEWKDFYAQYGSTRLKRTLDGEWREWYRGRIVDPSQPIIGFDTFHASKGLESDTVVVLRDITERVENEGDRDEEIRLAYVAITRGRNHVLPVDVDSGWKSRWIPTSGSFT